MNRSLAPAAVLCLVSLLPCAVLAQQNPPSPQSLPKDPVALLKLASRVNGLHGDDLRPWHVHATWTEVDKKGNQQDEGTFEEWWAGDNKFKIVVHSGDLMQTIYGTDRGRFIAKPAANLPRAYLLVQRLISLPVPDLQLSDLKQMRLRYVPFHQGEVSLDCVVGAYLLSDGTLVSLPDSIGDPEPAFNHYCFNGDPPLVRAETTPWTMTAFNSIVRFQGHYLARAFRESLVDSGRSTDISVDLVEVIGHPSESDFVPPPGLDLEPDAQFIHVDASLMRAHLIGGGDPRYPEDAAQAHLEGVVEVSARILKDGHVGEVKVVRGPIPFRAAAYVAVKNWRFRPFLLAGQPVEVETMILVNFRLRQ